MTGPRARGGSRTIGEWLGEAAQRAPSASVLVAGQWTGYQELDEVSGRVAGGFAAIGLRRGDRVCVLMRSSVACLEVWFGLAKSGLVEVPLNVASGSYLLRYFLEHAGAKAIVCDAEFESRVRECVAGVDSLVHLIVHREDGDEHCGGGSELDPAGLVRHRLPALADQPLGDLGPVDPTDTAVILYTSGTTGPPKGALLSHRANVNLARHTVDLLGYTEEDRLYSVFPLFHSNARYCSVMAAIEAGADLVLDRTFSASRFWDRCREHGVTAFNYQGAMMSILHKRPPRADDADNPVRLGFGAPCPPEIFASFERRFAVRLTEIYGSTEVSIVTDMPPHRRKIGTAGSASANYEVAVVDERDEPLPPGAAGEIVARPVEPGWMFDGYHAMPEATAKSWRNLWFHTGDRGRLDEDGYLTFLDRIKDTVRRRGENISSWEVERVVSDHPAVAQAAAYGVPSEVSEEDVMVAVVLAPGRSLAPAELIAHCSGSLTSFALPRYVRVLPELPMTPSQRVEKYKLQAEGVTADTWDREANLDDC
ncbi:ATP-dependent acyl-CoA ligase [Saccharopolyspora karakumensis]|uniref:ATP-dependent acyl-CoA ligase n=1 Tax=Saccharopolyspora karakumensis TaxID=2530386 RepID=A0A4R5B406_9PSEU|nr:AMP-binding protein [Saccharopolyspora karakumensis]TDD80938.1 ATP-dependent acyl-CoA ligase [Saccharopolyspora karakumensis]